MTTKLLYRTCSDCKKTEGYPEGEEAKFTIDRYEINPLDFHLGLDQCKNLGLPEQFSGYYCVDCYNKWWQRYVDAGQGKV